MLGQRLLIQPRLNHPAPDALTSWSIRKRPNRACQASGNLRCGSPKTRSAGMLASRMTVERSECRTLVNREATD